MSLRPQSAGPRNSSSASRVGNSQRRAQKAQRRTEGLRAFRYQVQQKRLSARQRYLNAFKRAGSLFRTWWLKLAGLLMSVVRPIVVKPQGLRPVRRSNRPEQAFLGASRSVELLEPKALLTNLYVDNFADYVETTNNGGTPGLVETGDEVTWVGADPGTGDDETGLIFGTTAFDTLAGAVNAAVDGDSVFVGPGEGVDRFANATVSGTKAISIVGSTGVTEVSSAITVDAGSSLTVSDVNIVATNGTGDEFIGGTGSVTIGTDTEFTIEVQEEGDFTISLDVDNSGNIALPTSTGAAQGTFAYQGASDWLYTVNAPVEGPSAGSFDFETVASFTGTVNIVILPVDDAPELTVPADTSVSEGGTTPALTGFAVTDVDSTSVTAAVTLSETADGQFQGEGPNYDDGSFTAGSLAVTGSGSAIVTGSGSGSVNITGTPAEVQATLDSLTYSAAGEFFGTATVSVDLTPSPTVVSESFDITVNNVNDAPLLVKLRTNDGLTEGQTGKTITGRNNSGNVVSGSDLVFGDSDHAPVDIVYSVASITNGVLRIGPSSAGSGTVLTLGDTFTQNDLDTNTGAGADRLRFDHDGSETATAGFTFTVMDAAAAGSPDTTSALSYNFAVTSVNDAPVAKDDDLATNADDVLTGNVLADNGNGVDSDEEGSTLTVDAVTGGTVDTQFPLASGALLTLNSDGSFEYDPNGAFDGLAAAATDTDTFTYTITDGALSSNLATVEITITGVNEGPTLVVNNGLTLSEGTSSLISMSLLQYADVDNTSDQLAYTVDTPTANGVIRKSGAPVSTFTQEDIDNGLITYLHDDSNNLTDSFAFTVSDGTASVSDTFSIVVNNVNDAPTLDNAIADQTATQDVAFSLPIPATTFSDSDAGDVLTLSLEAGPAWLTLSGGVLTGTPGPTDVGGPFTVTIRATDLSLDFAEDSFDLTVNNVNDAPVLSPGTTPNVTYTEGDSPLVVVSAIAIADADAGELFTSATVSVVTGYVDGEDVLAVDVASLPGAVLPGLVMATFNTTTGILTISGSGTLAEYQGILQNVTYENTSDAPTDSPNRVLEFQVTDDGAAASNVATGGVEVIAVNNEPVLTVADFDVAEGQTKTLTTTEISIVDPDNAASELTVNLDSLPSTAEVQLNGVALGVDGTFTYQELIDGDVTYVDMSPGVGTDSFAVSIDDDDGMAAFDDGSDTINVNVTEVNDKPEVAVINPGNTFTEDASPSTGGPAVVVDGGVTVSDIDDTNLEGATVTIDSPVTGDVLAFTPVGSITGSFATGVLTLSGTGTLAEYQTALQSVKFQNTGDNPDNFGADTSRTISFVVNDGELNSDAGDVTLNVTAVNDDPVLSLAGGGTVSYTEGDLATFIDSGMTVMDVDDTDLTSATVTIAGYNSAEDVFGINGLSTDLVTDTAGGPLLIPATDLQIASTVVGTDVTFVISGQPTFSTDTLANFQSVLQSLTYVNSNTDNPDTTNRVVDIFVTDPSAADSTTETVTISVATTADIPVLDSNTEMTINENQTSQPANYLTTANLNVSDPDGVAASGIIYTLTGISHPSLVELELDTSATSNSQANATDIVIGGTFTQADIDATDGSPAGGAKEGLRVRSLGTDVPPDQQVTFTFSVSDGTETLTPVTLTVNLNRVNDTPLTQGQSTGDFAIDATEEVDGTPADTTITMADLFHNDEETDDASLIITIDDAADLPANGNLVIDGTAVTAVDIPVSFTQQDVIDGKVEYRHTDTAQQGPGTDSFTYNVTDGAIPGSGSTTLSAKSRNNQTFTINIVAANDSPVAVNDDLSVAENGTIVGGDVLAANAVDPDSDVEGDTLTVTEVNGSSVDVDTQITLTPSGALLTLNSDGTFDYDPNGQFESLALTETATDSFEYTISDGNGGTDTATVTITITGENDPPTVPSGQTFDIDEDAMAADVVGQILASDDDTTDTLAFTQTGSSPFAISSTGEITVFGALDAETTGSYTVTFEVDDGTVTTPASVTIDVNDVNEAPTLTAPLSDDAVEEVASSIDAAGFVIGDPDLPGDTLTATLTVTSGTLELVGTPSGVTISDNGTAILTLVGLASDLQTALNSGDLQYTGNLDIAGSPGDTINVALTDGTLSATAADVDLNILNINDKPIADAAANALFLSVQQNVSLDVNVVTGATPGPTNENTQTVFLVGFDPSGIEPLASVMINPGTGVVTYTPAPGFTGTDSFTYTLQDDGGTANAGDEDSTIVTVTVEVVDVLPDAVDDSFTATEGALTTPATSLFANDVSGQVGAPTLTHINGVAYIPGTTGTILTSGGSLSIDASGLVTYTSDIADESASDSFTYTLTDVQGNTDDGTVSIDITDVNDSPTTADVTGAATATEGDTVTFDASGSTDADVDADLTYSFVAKDASLATVASQSSSSIATFPVTFADDGIYTIEVTATDRSGVADTAMHTITVANVVPTVTLSGQDGSGPVLDGGSVDEGTTFVLTLGPIIDAGDDVVTKYNVKWGDGTIDANVPYVPGGPNFLSHLYTDDSALVNLNDIQVDLFDEDGAHINAASFALTVNNLDPTINSLTGNLTGNEGSVFSYAATATDPAFANDPLTFTWDFGDGSSTQSGVSLNNVNHVYTTGGNYTVTLTVTDGDGGSDVETLAVFVNSLLGPVTDTEGAPGGSVAENAAGATVGITALATDADVTDTVSYSLASGDFDNDLFSIDSGGVVTTIAGLDAEDTQTRTIEVTATSSDGSTSTAQFTINVVDDTSEAVVGPVTDTEGAPGGSVAENAAGATVGITALATDADVTDTVSYSLASGDFDNDLFSIDSGGVVTTIAGLDAEDTQTRKIEVTATSDDGSTSTAQFTINVVDDTSEAVVGPVTDTDATSGFGGGSVAENAAGATVGITALATDADVTDTVSYSLASGDFDNDLFSIDSGGVVTTIAGLDAEDTQTRKIKVTATSDDGSTSTAQFTINVVDDTSEAVVGPVTDTDATSGFGGGSVAEGVVGATVGITALAVDPDVTDTVSYSITSSTPSGAFLIDSGGVVTTAVALDAESNAFGIVTVQAESTDGSTSSETFIVSITDVDDNDVGVVTDIEGASGGSVDENLPAGTAVGIEADATDADITNNAITYTLAASTLDNDEFQIDSSTGVVTTAGPLDYEAGTTRTIQVTATSSDLSFSTADFVIDVGDVSDFSVGSVSDIDTATNEVDENAAGATVAIQAFADDPDVVDTVTYSLPAGIEDNDLFSIDSSGVVTTIAGLDREEQDTRTITVRATSTDASFSEGTFSINVLDLNDEPVGAVTDTNLDPNQVPEAVGPLTFVGVPVGITAFAEDPDSTLNGITYTLTAGDFDNDLFVVDAVTGIVTLGVPLDAETALQHTIEVTATSDDGSFETEQFLIDVVDLDDNDVGPVSDVDTADNKVDENLAPGAPVGVEAFAEDLDATMNGVTYALTSNPGSLFQINPTSGVVTTNATLDAEFATSHTIEVTATSEDFSTSSMSFTIVVNDLNESPISVITDADLGTDEVNENSAGGTTVGIIALATDSDVSDEVTYSLDNDAGGRFVIDPGSGVVSVAPLADLDFEAATSHLITVKATSDDLTSETKDFTIQVLDLADQDVGDVTDIDNATNEVAENASSGTPVGITASATDPDGDTVEYTLESGVLDNDLFSIDLTTGIVSVNAALDFETSALHQITVRATSSDLSISEETFSIVVTDVDEVAPTAGPIEIASTAWTDPDFLAEVDPTDSTGFEISDGSNLSWLNLDTISVTFSEDVIVSAGDLSLTGWSGNGTASTPSDFVAEFGLDETLDTGGFTDGFRYDPLTNTATWVLGDVFAKVPGTANRVIIGLTGVTDLTGNGVAPLTVDEFTVNPGNVNPTIDDEIVDFTDVGYFLAPNVVFSEPGDSEYIARADIDGNGIIDYTDFGLVYPNRLFVEVPVPPASFLGSFLGNGNGNGSGNGSGLFGDDDDEIDSLFGSGSISNELLN